MRMGTSSRNEGVAGRVPRTDFPPQAEAIAQDLDLVMIPGTEITTFHGHSVVLGVTQVPEWRAIELRC